MANHPDFKDSNGNLLTIGDEVKLTYVTDPSKGAEQWMVYETNHHRRPARVIGFARTRVKLLFDDATKKHDSDPPREFNVAPENLEIVRGMTVDDDGTLEAVASWIQMMWVDVMADNTLQPLDAFGEGSPGAWELLPKVTPQQVSIAMRIALANSRGDS